ncbi:glycerate kinase [Streptomyces buecherae]|uniref:Glycerate kinase n=1 Tax=Streptomyces buecherae TaxID=2763006 RepID=A0A7H8N4S5_9ACTN|nr:glycerate kinase [Streptomyces buecherae]QKW49460.1 glycerate kinase [Streptomyces buecherae]
MNAPAPRPLRFAVAPSGFKESLTAREAAEAIAEGLQRVVPDADTDLIPLVDGGEGTAEALAAATGGALHHLTATGPTGVAVPTHFALLGPGARGAAGGRAAVVEMAAVAGLSLVPPDQRDPGATTTRGVGELVRAALDFGARRILVGCGDSGTSDGGAGALQALGARLLDADGRELPPGGRALARLARVDRSRLDPRLADTELLVACNPFNVLCGPQGVARVFGPQKGASPAQVEELSAALERWARILARDVCGPAVALASPTPGLPPYAAPAPAHTMSGAAPALALLPSAAGGVDLRHGPGTGASGGLGAGLAALGARLLPRFDVLLDGLDLDARLARADLVVTAEGALDRQTTRGKIPAEVARRAKAHGRPVLALAGTIGEGAREVRGAGVDAYHGILPAPVALAEALGRGREFLADAAEAALRMILIGTRLTGAPGRFAPPAPAPTPPPGPGRLVPLPGPPTAPR